MPEHDCRFQRLRLAAGLTQVELADLTGLAQSTIVLNEQGQPSDRYIIALAKALRITVEDLLDPRITVEKLLKDE